MIQIQGAALFRVAAWTGGGGANAVRAGAAMGGNGGGLVAALGTAIALWQPGH
jgi:hypothetical protein